MLLYAELSEQVIAAIIEVHGVLGPGLLESAYEECLCYELALRGIRFTRQQLLPLDYKGKHLDCGYRLDIVVEDKIVLELKAVDELHPIHEAQVLTYLKLSGYRVGLLINFNSTRVTSTMKRIVH